MPETANLMEFFGWVSASCPSSATSWTKWPPAKATSGRAANIPAELIVLRNERRSRPSFCIGAPPIYVDIVWGFFGERSRYYLDDSMCGKFHRGAYLF